MLIGLLRYACANIVNNFPTKPAENFASACGDLGFCLHTFQHENDYWKEFNFREQYIFESLLALIGHVKIPVPSIIKLFRVQYRLLLLCCFNIGRYTKGTGDLLPEKLFWFLGTCGC